MSQPEAVATAPLDKAELEHDEYHDRKALPYEPSVNAAEVGVKPSLIQALRMNPKASFLCTLAALGALSDGFQLTIPGNIISNKGFIQQFGAQNAKTGKWALNPLNVSAWGGAYTGAYIAVLLLGTWPADKFGRKACLLVVQILMAVACIMEIFAKDWKHWLGAKMVDGLSIGLNQASATTYISEMAPTGARGALLASYAFWWALGQFAASVGLQIMNTTTPLLWRRAIYSQWVFTGLATIAWIFLPESPRWLASKGREEASKKVLLQVNGGVAGYDVDKEYAVLEAELAAGRKLSNEAKQISFFSVFRGSNLRRTLISFGPFAWQTWVGNTIIYGYTSYFFQLAGLKNIFLGVVATKIINVVFIVLSFWTIERVGRRTTLLTGGGVCVASMIVLGGVLFQSNTAVTGPVLITFACLWTAAYALSLGPLGITYLAETSTVLLRAKTIGAAAAGTGMLNLISNYCTPLMLADANFGTKSSALFYGGTGIIGWLLVFFFVPETKGRSYAELDELFERRIPARKFASTETSVDIARKEREAGHV